MMTYYKLKGLETKNIFLYMMTNMGEGLCCTTQNTHHNMAVLGSIEFPFLNDLYFQTLAHSVCLHKSMKGECSEVTHRRPLTPTSRALIMGRRGFLRKNIHYPHSATAQLILHHMPVSAQPAIELLPFWPTALHYTTTVNNCTLLQRTKNIEELCGNKGRGH